MKESSRRRDYREYIFSARELVRTVFQCAGVVMLLAFFFYRSLLAAIPLAAVGVLFFRELKRKKRDAYREALVEQFRECILSVGTSMKAGYAVENAFMESREDMRLLYGETSAIYQELELIRRGLVINITLEELLDNLAERSGSEEIQQFAEVFRIAKRNSGNLGEIMDSSARLISQRVDIRQEIRTLLGAKRMELTVMRLMPFAIMCYINLSYTGYLDVLYHNLQGILLMTGCLLLYLGAYALGELMLQRIAQELL